MNCIEDIHSNSTVTSDTLRNFILMVVGLRPRRVGQLPAANEHNAIAEDRSGPAKHGCRLT